MGCDVKERARGRRRRARVRQRGVRQGARAAPAAVLQVQGRGLLLQGVPGGKPSRPRRAPCAVRVCSLTRTATFPCPSRRQIAAWKAGHKHKCGAQGQGAAAAKLRSAARAGAALGEAARAPAGLTAEQNRLVTRLQVLQAARQRRLGPRLHELQAAHAIVGGQRRIGKMHRGNVAQH